MPSAFTLLAFVMPGWPSRHLPPWLLFCGLLCRVLLPQPRVYFQGLPQVLFFSLSPIQCHDLKHHPWMTQYHRLLPISRVQISLFNHVLKNLTWDMARDKVMTTTLSKCPFHLSKGRTTLLLFTPRGPSLLSSPAAHSTSSSATIGPLVSTSTMPALSTDAAHRQDCDPLRCISLLALISYFILHVF